MRLILPHPDGWEWHDLDASRSRSVVSGTLAAPDVAVTLHHPRRLQVSIFEWASDVVSADIGPGESVEVVDGQTVEHELGFWTLVQMAIVRRPDRQDPVEIRLAAFYQMTDYAAAAVVEGRRLDVYEERRPELLALLLRAAPRWLDPACIADLYT